MLNLVAFDPKSDTDRLQRSFDSIKNKDSLEIVMNEGEKNTILLKVKFALAIREAASIRFQNLFKLTLPNGHFYIAQCLLNYGFSASSLDRQTNNHEYRFQIVAVADIKIDLGKTVMRPETRTDKIVGRFFGSDIDLEDTRHFNDKYYLASNKPEMITKYFDKAFVNTISKYDDLQLIAIGNEMFITFDREFKTEHSRAVEDILSNCQFLFQ